MNNEESSADRVEFEEMWPELSTRLRRVLRSRRVPTDVIDDLVQEAGLKLYRSWDRVDPDTVWAFANTVVLNLVRDEMRKQEVRHRLTPAPIEESENRFDESILARLELKRVRRVLTRLPHVDRSVLLAEWGEASDIEFVSPAAHKMAKMRARKRLRAALDRASALLPVWRLRRAIFMSNFSEQLSQVAIASVAVAIGFAALSAPLFSGGDPSAIANSPGIHSFTGLMDDDVQLVSARADARPSPKSITSITTAAIGGGSAGRSPVRSEDEDMNANFGPVKSDGGNLVVGGSGNGVGPFGAEEGAETSQSGHEASARARARYDAPKCEGEIVVGGKTDYHCDGSGEGSAGAEADADGEHHEVGTP